MKVFLVDDSPLVLERLTEMLGTVPGTTVIGRATGVDEAIAGILAAKPDVVVLDLNLGVGSGFQVLREVREHRPEIDFYMLSNFASEPYRRHAEQLGALGFFDKSSEFEQVRDIVKKRAAYQH